MPDEITTTMGDCNSCNTYDLNGTPVRTTVLNGQRVYALVDLAAAFGLARSSVHRRADQLPEAEQGVAVFASAGGRQRTRVVTAAGLSRIVSRLRLSMESARRLQTWFAEVNGEVMSTGQYTAPELPPEQPNPSTAITPAATDTPSLEALAQMAETQLGIVRQMQQIQRDVQQMRSDVQQEMTMYVDHLIEQRSRGLRDEMDGLRQNYSIVRDLVDEAGVERLIESVVGQMIEHQVHRQTAELRHTIGDLMEDVGVLQQRTEPPPGLSVLDQVRHVVDHYCRSTRSSHRDVYGCLYKQFTSRHHTDLPRRSKMAGARSVLEFVAERDKDERIATMLLSLAHDLFGFAPLVPRLPSDEDFERYRADCEMTDRIASEIEGGTWH